MSRQLDIFNGSEREPQPGEATPQKSPGSDASDTSTAARPSRSGQLNALPGTTFEDIFACPNRVLVGHSTRRRCNGTRGHKGVCW